MSSVSAAWRGQSESEETVSASLHITLSGIASERSVEQSRVVKCSEVKWWLCSERNAESESAVSVPIIQSCSPSWSISCVTHALSWRYLLKLNKTTQRYLTWSSTIWSRALHIYFWHDLKVYDTLSVPPSLQLYSDNQTTTWYDMTCVASKLTLRCPPLWSLHWLTRLCLLLWDTMF